jgi:ubiquinone/menaquinone biosynthesis C-methylase UbiE
MIARAVQVIWNPKNIKATNNLFLKNKEFRLFFKDLLRLEGSERVLDLGTRIGTLSRLFYLIYGSRMEIHGVGKHRDLIKWAQSRWGKPDNITLHHGVLHALTFPDAYFDVVSSSGLFEWEPDPMPALDEMIRTCKPGGKMVTLIFEVSQFERTPKYDKDSFIYGELLRAYDKLCAACKNPVAYVHAKFGKRNLNLVHETFVMEQRTEITERMFSLWESPTFQENMRKSWMKSLDFYLQVLEPIGWTRESLFKFISSEFQIQDWVDFWRTHEGEFVVERMPVHILHTTNSR